MKVKVRLFATLREVFGGEEKVVELKDGSNIQDLMDALCCSERYQQPMDYREWAQPLGLCCYQGRRRLRLLLGN